MLIINAYFIRYSLAKASPSPALGKELIEFSLDGTTADISYINAGHLCILPTIPMIHESFVIYDTWKSVMKWGRIESDEGKVKESHECQKLFDSILVALNKYL